MNLDTITKKQLLRDSVHYFGMSVFGYRTDGHHGLILDHMLENKFNLTLVSRGHGKSLMVSVMVAWLLVNEKNTRIIIVSDTDRKATLFLKKIKTIIESSPVIKEFYGDLKGTTWSDHSITINTRDQIFAEPSLLAVGAGSGQITGMHANHIFIDDMVSFDSSRSDLQRTRDKDWFKTSLIPVLLSSGSISIVGTRYHPKDFYDMIKEELKYKTLIMPAINKDGTALCEWLYPLKDRINEAGEVIKKGLETVREELGSLIWSLQFLNDVTLANEDHIIKPEYINYYDSISWEDNKLKVIIKGSSILINKIILGVDPAISEKNTADFSAFVVIGKGSDGNFYVLDSVAKHLTFNSQIKQVEDLAIKWQINQTNIEKVAYQEALIQELKRKSGLKINAISPSRDKLARLNLVSGFFEAGKVHFLKKQTEIVNQLLTFTGEGKDHDDLVDACVYSLWGYRSSGSGMIVLKM